MKYDKRRKVLMGGETEYTNIIEPMLEFFNTYIIPSLMVIATCVFVVLAIVNGIRYAKASQEEDKQKAKKNIIGMVIGAAVCVAGVWLMPLIFDLLAAVFGYGNGVQPL